MPDIDSISIELTASTESAESSIDKLIGKLNQLKSAVSKASDFSKVSRGIASIAAVANGIDNSVGQKLHRLASGLEALSNVGDLSNLRGAASVISSIMRAANNAGNSAGSGLNGLANGIKSTADALSNINDANVGKLGEIRDALSGEASGPLHQSGVGNESAELGGGTASYNFGGDMVASGAMNVFGYVSDKITNATNAYDEFRTALGAGMPPIFTDFADDATRAANAIRLLTGSVGGEQAGPWIADEIRDATRATDEFSNSLHGAGETIETEFVDNAHSAFSGFGHLLSNIGTTIGGIGAYLGTTLLNVGKAILGLGAQIARIAKYRIIRAMLKDMTQSFKDLYGWSQLYGTDFARSMDTINTAFVYLRNSIAAMVAPLVNALAPALDFVIDKIVDVLNWFNQLFAALSGADTYTVAKKVAQKWGDTFDKTSGSAKKAAEDAKRTILGFDEINKLTKQATSGSGSGSGSSPFSSGYETMFEEKHLTGGFKGISDAMNTEITDKLSQITSNIGKYELAIGAILALSGANVPLGIALIASGAVMMGSAIIANWDGISDQIKLCIGAVEAALAGGLAVGAILAFSSGNIPLGIGLMIGALSTGFGAVDIVWTTLADKVGGQVQAITTLIGGAMFGIGAVIAFAGHPGIGIAMMIAGASVAAVSINWDYIEEKLTGPIGAVTALISGASLVLGILAIVGGMVPLGIGLILAGAAGLATTVAANWDNLTTFFNELWTNIKTAAENTWDVLKEIGSGIWGKIKEGITGIDDYFSEQIEDCGGDIVAGILKGIVNGLVNIAVWIVENIFTPFINGFKEAFGIHSPASTMEEPGKDIVLGIYQGIIDALKNVGKWIKDNIFDPIWEGIKKAGSIAITFTVSLIKKAGEWASDAWTLVKTGTANFIQSVKARLLQDARWVKDAWSLLKEKSAAFIQTVTAKLKKGAQWVADAWALVKDKTKAFTQTVTALLEKGATWVTDAWTLVKDKTKEFTQTVTAVLKKSMAWAADAWTLVKDKTKAFTQTVTALLSKGATWVADAWTLVKDKTKAFTQTVTANLAKGATWVADAWTLVKDKTNAFTQTVTANLAKGTTWVADAWTLITQPSSVTKTVNAAFSIATNALSNLWKDLKDKWDKFVSGKWLGIDVKVGPSIDEEDAGATKTAQDYAKKMLTPLQKAIADYVFYLPIEPKAAWETVNKDLLSFLGIGDLSSYVSIDTIATWAQWGSTIYSWLDINNLESSIAMNPVKNWIGSVLGVIDLNNVKSDVKMDLTKEWNGKTPQNYLGLDNLSTTIKAKLAVDDKANTVTATFSGGGTGKGVWTLATKALGGIFSGGAWRNIPQYAGGTTDAGSLFLAGEAGPELVGHVGGRTEVLNKSQLASAMFAAVQSAMAPASANFASAAQSMGYGSAENDYDAMYDVIFDAVSEAMAGDSGSRERTQLLRQINDKDFRAEISTASLNRAQNRMNRRAGTTLVPVG